MFGSAKNVIKEASAIVRPPVRMTVAEAAEKYVHIKVPGKYNGPYKNDMSPAMVEPAECITSRNYEEIAFCGPAQSGKTQGLVLNPVAHAVKCDMMDMMIVEKDRSSARDFSRKKLDRLLNMSPELNSQMANSRNADNTHDKMFKSGIFVNIGWPTRNQLAGKTIGRIFLTDYDRMPDDVGGEGSAFSQAGQRTTVFMSKAMALAESTPSKDVEDPEWEDTGTHEAPPTKGILGIYNSGDRRRLYCQCPFCDDYFMPSPYPSAFFTPENGSVEERAELAGLICTGCGEIISQEYENDIRYSGVWVGDGQSIDANGEIHGEKIRSTRASFWQVGVFAAFRSWRSLITKYLRAYDNYERTGDEEELKNVYNQNFAAPYIYEGQKSNNKTIAFMSERAEPLDRFFVPNGCRALIAAVDIQGGAKARFEVSVIGFGEGDQKWPIDRYAIEWSGRGTEENKIRINPASFLEDWDILKEKIINATYRIDSDMELGIRAVAIDTGGESGVTKNAYSFWRNLEQNDKNKVLLIKGASHKAAPPVEKRFPDTAKVQNSKSGSHGDVPVYFINGDNMKDRVDGDLNRTEEGYGYIHFPTWYKDEHYEELIAEKRTTKGWELKSGKPNETLDLFYYTYGIWHFLGGFTGEFWKNPPHWARDFTSNSCVVSKDSRVNSNNKTSASRRTRFVFN